MAVEMDPAEAVRYLQAAMVKIVLGWIQEKQKQTKWMQAVGGRMFTEVQSYQHAGTPASMAYQERKQRAGIGGAGQLSGALMDALKLNKGAVLHVWGNGSVSVWGQEPTASQEATRRKFGGDHRQNVGKFPQRSHNPATKSRQSKRSYFGTLDNRAIGTLAPGKSTQSAPNWIGNFLRNADIDAELSNLEGDGDFKAALKALKMTTSDLKHFLKGNKINAHTWLVKQYSLFWKK